jgi:sugar lactone lactonase YvrE
VATTRLKVELALAAHASVGEGPRWDERSGTLVFVDIDAGRVFRFDPVAGAVHSFTAGGPASAVAFDEDGGLILPRGQGFVICGATGEQLRPAAQFTVGDDRVRFNDGAVDPWGRLVAGTMDLDLRRPIGALYRLDADGVVERLLTGITVSNGIGWSADARLMYYVDSTTAGLDVFALGEEGALGARSRLVQFHPSRDSGPDGLTLDAEGCIWVAFWGDSAVRRITPGGRIDATIRLPVTNVTSVAFGGRELDELYITTARAGLDERALSKQPHAGDLFVALPGVTGLPSTRFRNRENGSP